MAFWDDFFTQLKLIFAFGYLVSIGSGWLADGAEYLTTLMHPALVGGLILPILGALPDAMIIFMSCMGDPKEAEIQVRVGVGTLAGSTIMLMTIPMVGTMFLGRCDIAPHGNCVDEQCGKWNWKSSWVKQGVTVTRDCRISDMIMMVTLLPYLVVQIPAFAMAPESTERLVALISCILCGVLLVGYSSWSIAFPHIQKGKIDRYRKKERVNAVVERLRSALTQRRAGEALPLLGAFGSTNRARGAAAEGTDGAAPAAPAPTAAAKSLGMKWKLKAKDAGERRSLGLPTKAEEAKQDEEEEEDEDEVEAEEASGASSKGKIWFKALLWMTLGTVLISIFSDPLVDAISAWSHVLDPNDRLQFIVGFVICPIATNASELITSLVFARKKRTKVTGVSFAALLGAATMNNTLCLGVFLAAVYFRNLSWQFRAEVTTIVTCVLIAGLLNLSVTHRMWKTIVFGLIYPFAIGMVFFLEQVIHWD